MRYYEAYPSSDKPIASYPLPLPLLRKPEKQCPFLSLRCFETMVDIKRFGFLSECMNHNRPHPDILSYPITA
ncbi:Uncharacterised protein [Enterobacter hormaechei]|nr:Uncharacterised protein [Enterobacter hormaechei]VAM40330.1 Uncharacterised protein [Enterobacter hormaechei]